jgi:cytochrome c peroxidase
VIGLRRAGAAAALAASALLGSLAARAVPAASAPPFRYVPHAWGARPTVAEMSSLGRRIFFDAGLSASGRQACASCHSPANAFGPPNDLAVQPGGAEMTRSGTRSVPTLRYVQTSIPFTQHYIDDDDAGGQDAGPTGGLTWDGRADSPSAQAALPLTSPNEMANASPRELAARMRASSYAREFRDAFSAPGRDVFDDPERVMGWAAAALEVYQESAEDFYPFTSKYDAFLRRQTTLTESEARGLALFNDPRKGNCASCHPSAIRSSGAFPVFTDFGYVALGAPRNAAIPANRDPAYFDLGLCGPERIDLRDSHPDDCGRFKTPTLRNVATRKVFFHNGVFHSLREVLAFYVRRDLTPERWYPRRPDGTVRKYDDLPATYRDNVTREAPFTPSPDGRPRLDDAEIDDVVAFLDTLTDGYASGGRTHRSSQVDATSISPR